SFRLLALMVSDRRFALPAQISGVPCPTWCPPSHVDFFSVTSTAWQFWTQPGSHCPTLLLKSQDKTSPLPLRLFVNQWDTLGHWDTALRSLANPCPTCPNSSVTPR